MSHEILIDGSYRERERESEVCEVKCLADMRIKNGFNFPCGCENCTIGFVTFVI